MGHGDLRRGNIPIDDTVRVLEEWMSTVYQMEAHVRELWKVPVLNARLHTNQNPFPNYPHIELDECNKSNKTKCKTR